MRILWLKTELLHPVDKGGKIRTYYMLRELKRGHHVTYLTLDDGGGAHDAAERAQEYCHELIRIPFRPQPKFTPGFYRELVGNLLSPLPYFMAKYRSPAMQRAVAERIARGDVDLLVADFLMPSINIPFPIPCPTVLFQHNVEALIWKRHYEVQRNPLKRAYLREQWRKTIAYERAACRRFDTVVAVSVDDRDAMRRDYGVQHTFNVPTGVDTEFFRSSREEASRPYEMVFTGSMDWLPNEDAIRFFVERIFPLIRQTHPHAKLTVVGRNPTPALRELAGRDASVVVTGRVEDVRPYMERAAVYVIPLRIGGGTRLKVYEAMAMGKPIVSTTIGAEGLPVRDGVDLLLADEPQEFAAAVVRMFSDATLARELGERAAATARERFGWNRVAAEFAALCHDTVERRAHAPRNARDADRRDPSKSGDLVDSIS